MSMRVYIKDRKRRKDEFQFFMHDFVDECQRSGFKTVPDILPTYKLHIRSVIRRLLLLLYDVMLKYNLSLKKKKALIVTANGITIADNYFPYYFKYELIPMLWDVWPSTWLQMQRDFQRFGVKTVFVTVQSVANLINEEIPGIRAVWIPEGINSSHYHKGKPLVERPHNILEMGRQMKKYHSMLEGMHNEGILNGWTTSVINSDGTLSRGKLTFPDNETLYRELPNYKIMICFPQCDTNPFRGGNVETLTQRYWEAMLSGCLMIGRAPAELIDLCGYDPVVNVDWNNPREQIVEILNHIENYQDVVNENYDFALFHADWKCRIPYIKECLQKEGYQF